MSLQMKTAGPVLIVDLSNLYTGTEARVFEIAKAIHGKIPYAVAVLARSPLHRLLDDAGLISLPLPVSKYDPRLVLRISREIRRQGFVVVDAHNTQSQLWSLFAARLCHVPRSISTVHASYRPMYSGLKGWIHEGVLRLNAYWKCHFIAVSDSVLEYLKELGVSRSAISLIYNGISMADEPAPSPPISLRASLGWGEDAFIVITVGNLRQVKGHKYLLEALSSVIPKRPLIRCLFVGEGQERGSLEHQARNLGIHEFIHFAGYRRDVPALLGESNAFCLPSLTEALPFAVLEACTHRLPLLITSVGDLPKLFTQDKNALLVPPGDPSALANGLLSLYDNQDHAALMGLSAYTMVRDVLSPEKMISRTMCVYQNVNP